MSRDSGSEQPTQRTVAELLAEYGNSGSSGNNGSSGEDGAETGEDGQRSNARRRRRRAEDPTETAPQTIIDRVLSDSGKLRPIDPAEEAPTRTGHRAEPEESAPAADSDAAAQRARDEQVPAATQEGSPDAARRSAEDAASSPVAEPTGRSKSEQPAKSGKGNYWARRFSVGRKSQTRQQQSDSASAPSGPERSTEQRQPDQATGRLVPPASTGEQSAAGNGGDRGDTAAASEHPVAPSQPAEQYPQQAGQVDPEATVRQFTLPAAQQQAGQQQESPQERQQQPGPQTPGQQPQQPRPGQLAPHPGRPAQGVPPVDAQPRVVEGATEQLPAVRPQQPGPDGAEGGTAMLPTQEAVGSPSGGVDVPGYPDQAAYLGQAGPGARLDSYDYDDLDAHAPDVYADEDYDDYADYADLDEEDVEYDPSVPAGMTALDHDEDDEDEEVGDEPASGRREWFVLAGSTVLSLLTGGVVWFAFRWLWTTFAPAALVAALAITGCLVFVARKYLRIDDLQSVLLAVLVGLVCTVSPAAVLLIHL